MQVISPCAMTAAILYLLVEGLNTRFFPPLILMVEMFSLHVSTLSVNIAYDVELLKMRLLTFQMEKF